MSQGQNKTGYPIIGYAEINDNLYHVFEVCPAVYVLATSEQAHSELGGWMFDIAKHLDEVNMIPGTVLRVVIGANGKVYVNIASSPTEPKLEAAIQYRTLQIALDTTAQKHGYFCFYDVWSAILGLSMPRFRSNVLLSVENDEAKRGAFVN